MRQLTSEETVEQRIRDACHIAMELELAGIPVWRNGSGDYAYLDVDDDYQIWFDKPEHRHLFLSMVQIGPDWGIVDEDHSEATEVYPDPVYTVAMPLTDMPIVRRALERINAITVENYEETKLAIVKSSGGAWHEYWNRERQRE